MLPAFYKIGTLADMTYMARKLALARKAIVAIRTIEDNLEANKTNVLEEELMNAMRQTKDYALTVANSIQEATTILRSVKTKVSSFRESVHDAVD
jgi:hypothetical protein